MSSEFISNPQRAARTDVLWGFPGGPVVKTACSNAETEIGSLVEKLGFPQALGLLSACTKEGGGATQIERTPRLQLQSPRAPEPSYHMEESPKQKDSVCCNKDMTRPQKNK